MYLPPSHLHTTSSELHYVILPFFPAAKTKWLSFLLLVLVFSCSSSLFEVVLNIIIFKVVFGLQVLFSNQAGADGFYLPPNKPG